MKLRLQIITSPDTSSTIEHSAPILRIGRDPQGEVVVAGSASQSVSWQHARIELTNRGAVLYDLGSTNGTYVNGHRVNQAVRIRAGDQIQLGPNGPRVQVLEVETIGAPGGPPLPGAGARRTEHLLLAGGVVVAFCILVAAAAVFFREDSGPPKPMPLEKDKRAEITPPDVKPPDTKPPDVAKPPDVVKPPDAKPPDTKPPDTKPPDTVPPDTKPPDTKPPDVKPPDVKPPDVKPPDVKPPAERRAVGAFVPGASPPLPVLVQRQEDKGPWQRVQPQTRLYTNDLLVSLPGYRSDLVMDSGVHLLLWGNVAEHLSLPILESAVVLHEPPPGTDLSFTLVTGRVVLANRKPKASAKIQVRFANQTWDVILDDSQSQVGIDQIGTMGSADPGSEPLIYAGLIDLRGSARLRIGVNEYVIQGPPRPSEYSWSSMGPGTTAPHTLPQMPAWWDTKLPAVAQWESAKLPPQQLEILKQNFKSMQEALSELSKRLTKASALEAVLAEDLRSPRSMTRLLALQSLGAIDALPALLGALADEKSLDVRDGAVAILRHWLGLRAGQQAILRQLLEASGYTSGQAETVLQLLHVFSREDVSKKQTYEVLIEFLKDDKLAIRQLAAWHLYRMVPDARKITYNAAGSAKERQAAYDQWQKLLAAGQLPPKATPK